MWLCGVSLGTHIYVVVWCYTNVASGTHIYWVYIRTWYVCIVALRTSCYGEGLGSETSSNYQVPSLPSFFFRLLFSRFAFGFFRFRRVPGGWPTSASNYMEEWGS